MSRSASMEPRSGLWVWAVAVALLAAANGLPYRHAGFPPFNHPVLEEYVIQDTAAVLTGARRLGSDLAFIQLLLYYGSAETREKHGHRTREDPGEHAGHLHLGREGGAVGAATLGEFPELMEHGLRVGSLDPFFHYAYLFAGSALGFNLNRADEAIEVLHRASVQDPGFPRYSLYLGALAYRQSDELAKVIPWLEESIKDPECPTMLKNILANMYRKTGNDRRAAEIFLDILDNARDRSYADLALQKLREIEKNLKPKR